MAKETNNGPITSAIKLAIKLTIKLKTYCSYNKQHFVVATTSVHNRVRRGWAMGREQMFGTPCEHT